MNKLFFSFTEGGTCNTYSFFASWNKDEIVEYEIERNGYYLSFNKPLLTKEKLDINQSKKFIDYVKKANIHNLKDDIKNNEVDLDKIKITIYDAPIYNTVYIDGNYVGTEVSNYKYLYLALMLCDDWAFNLLVDDVITNDNEDNNKQFTGKLSSFYYSYNDTVIQEVNGYQNQAKYENIAEFKEKLVDLFKNGNPASEYVPVSNWDWQVVLINDEDEIFYYCGDWGQYKELDELNTLIELV